MASDFTVICEQRQHFGDNETVFRREDPDAEFVAEEKTYAFDTPNADADAYAVLMFQAFGVSFRYNVLTVNDTAVPGGLPRSVERQWHSCTLLVPPGTLSADAPNQLRLEARNRAGEADGNLDDFMLSSIVLFYKTS